MKAQPNGFMSAVLRSLPTILLADAHRLRHLTRASSMMPNGMEVSQEEHGPLGHLADIAPAVEDLELRQKPPHARTGDGADDENRLLAGDLDDLLKETRDDLRECIIVHEYAEPLLVLSEVQFHHKSQNMHLSNGSKDDDDDEKVVPPLLKPGAVWDDTPRGQRQTNLAVNMYAWLTGDVGMIQVIPHGHMSSWTSKQKVPVAGFLCNHQGQHMSAPVLHATSTPCIPTSVDRSGMALSPDVFEVFVGTTRLEFDSKAKAQQFCQELAVKIGEDLAAQVWDATALGDFYQERNPNLANFVAMTRHLTTAEGWTKGTKSVLVVVMDWKVGDDTLSPYSKQESDPLPNYKNKIFPAVNDAFRKMSYGQFGIQVTFVPKVIRYTRDRNRYSAQDLPFPGLYNAAKESLEGTMADYKFDDYDLVYVIAPQVKPTGTKGVAYVGQKGAMCNGCETISDNFKIMVAVHELGHNLGLMHASSVALEYGNVFDWMGNYPDVIGLHYGLGYKYVLGWISSDYVYEVGDQDLPGLSTEVIINPFDTNSPLTGDQIAGIKISLSAASRDVWISFRSTTERNNRGVYVVLQEKDHANSELVDTACHTISQQDAHMNEGWVYLDRTRKVGVKVLSISAESARVHVFQVSSSDVPKIYGLDTFTDGETKCPRTCRDANLLITEYECPELKKQGYCSGGSLTMQGTKYSIKHDICPSTCGECSTLLKQDTSKSGGCEDSNVIINGQDCRGVVRNGWCGYDTSSGSSVGKDLCPASCGECPSPVTPSRTPFTFPAIKDTIGTGSFQESPTPPPAPPPPPPTPPPTPLVDPSTGASEGKYAPAPTGCHDDNYWKDIDGDGCSDYAQVIKTGKWTKENACNYNNGAARIRCKKTCGECQAVAEGSPDTCVDATCIDTFMEISGRCEQCVDNEKYCKMSFMREECPMTCGVCQPSAIASMAVSPSSVTNQKQRLDIATDSDAEEDDEECQDEKCVEEWALNDDKCPTCTELGPGFCDENVFAQSCKRLCNLCVSGGVPKVCTDVLATYTCNRYRHYGWCTRPDMKDAVQRQCPLTCGICKNEEAEDDAKGDDSDDSDDDSDDKGAAKDGDSDDKDDNTDDKDDSDDSDDEEDKGSGGVCVCKDAWSSPTDEGCETVQRWCPVKPCDGDTKNWCLVKNPGCTTEAKQEGVGQGWAYCNPEDYKEERASLEPKTKPTPDPWATPLAAPGSHASARAQGFALRFSLAAAVLAATMAPV